MRHGRRHAFDVGGQRGVVGDVIGGVLADDVDDARVAFLALCRLASPLARPGPRCSRVEAGHPACGSSRRPRPSPRPRTGPARSACRHLVQRGDEMHLRSARIGEADVHTPRNQGAHQAFGPIHLAGHSGTPAPSSDPAPAVGTYAGIPCGSNSTIARLSGVLGHWGSVPRRDSVPADCPSRRCTP